ncbi:MAG: TldD/PmbA family protein [Planctomycetota bacterium]
MDSLRETFDRIRPRADWCSLRVVRDSHERLAVRRNVVQPVRVTEDEGAMVTVLHRGGIGYGATSDLSVEGLHQAAHEAMRWAEATAGRTLHDFAAVPPSTAVGEYHSPVRDPWGSMPLPEKIDLLRRECERLGIDPRIVDFEASLWRHDSDIDIINSSGGEVHQRFERIIPVLTATAVEGVESQTRSLGGGCACRQGGLELLDAIDYGDVAPALAEEALALLAAPNCPDGARDLLLGPAQMILQIHESIGHPLELDRVLGDERNYAGTTFVKPEYFGSFRYGSDHLNVTFDPTLEGEFVSYSFDDEGTPATREHIIKEGILLRGLGGVISQARLGVDGVACSRGCGWNRPPIDRMGNLNLEPGDSTFEEMVAAVDRGVFMDVNVSWSIDDSRNKFQFGCEFGRLIEKGELTTLVKNPNYRGISSEFWNSLAMVGERSTFGLFGTPYCGKGEPNQMITVGHASPACLFRGVEVFGGDEG